MKTCSYCGREGADEQVFCKECGTEFTAPEPENEPQEPHDFAWLRKSLMFAAGGLFLFLGYFASLGPVMRLFAGPPMTTQTSINGTNISGTYFFTMWRTVPAWIHYVWYPAMSGAVDFEPYRKYLAMWDPPTVVSTSPPPWVLRTMNTN